MKFTKETISNEDREWLKHHEKIKDLRLSDHTFVQWMISSDRKSFLINLYGENPEREGIAFLFGFNDEIFRCTLMYKLVNNDIYWNVGRLRIPEGQKKNRKIITSAFKEALLEFGYGYDRKCVDKVYVDIS